LGFEDVSFSVQEGRRSASSPQRRRQDTLLKILSQITPPTRGQITMRGRVASLLEVELVSSRVDGRENIFLNAPF